MALTKKKIIVIVAAGVIFFIGIVLGRYLPGLLIGAGDNSVQKKALYWIDTMEPTVHYPGPGKSRMGMELVPVYPDFQKKSTDDQSILITSTIENNLGVRTAPVIQGTLSRLIETVGYISPDENKVTHIHSYSAGWIRTLSVKYSGFQVKKGDLLFELYSPELITIEQDYVLSLKSGDKNLIDSNHKRLLAFNVSEQQIQKITATQKADLLIGIYAPQDGFVTELIGREGMRVTPEMQIMVLLDLSDVWLMGEVFENQVAWVEVGQFGRATLDAFPGKVWEGAVDYVYPDVNPVTRTVKIRIRIDNPQRDLKLNMFANIVLSVDAKVDALSIPLEALIRNGESSYVVVSLGKGRYESRKVTAGIESGKRIQILSGLTSKEQVVVSGQFMLDSESNLKSGLERI